VLPISQDAFIKLHLYVFMHVIDTAPGAAGGTQMHDCKVPVHRFCIGCRHEQGIAVHFFSFAQFAHAKTAGKDYFAILNDAKPDSGYSGQLDGLFNMTGELGNPFLIEFVRLHAGASTSTMTIREPPSGASTIVAGPRTDRYHSPGAVKVFPRKVVVSSVSKSPWSFSPEETAPLTKMSISMNIKV